MSKETREWLSENILVGFTGKRGNAWHWREGDNNHFPGAVPLNAVENRLFNWEPKEVTLEYSHGGRRYALPGHKGIVRSDNSQALGVHSWSYQPHGYREWLVENVYNLLGGEVEIGSAGLLKGGAVAWVQVELSETQFAHGVEFRPTLLATTSLDGSIASTYKPVNTIVVCDNTREAALGEDTKPYRVKHTRHSKFVREDASERIGLQLHAQADVFTAEMDKLLNTEVTDTQFGRFIESFVPTPKEKGRSRTIAKNKHDKFWDMWDLDPRVCIWRNTAWGVMQLINTWQTHESSIKGDNRLESKTLDVLTGKSFSKDNEASTVLNKILEGV